MTNPLVLLVLILFIALAFYTVYYKRNKSLTSKDTSTKQAIIDLTKEYEINFTPFGKSHGFCNYTQPSGRVLYIFCANNHLRVAEKSKYKSSIPDTLKNTSILKYLSYAINNGDIKKKHV